MLSRDAAYDMDAALYEIKGKKVMVDTLAETQVILQILVAKGVITREEVTVMREKVRNSPGYKPLYDYLDMAEKKACYYMDNPEQHLRDIMAAKLDGKIL